MDSSTTSGTPTGVPSGDLLGCGFQIESVSRKTRIRWFLMVAGEWHRDRGFRSKQDVRAFILSLGRKVEWQVGFVFKLRGDDRTIGFVDKHGRASA